MSSQPDTDFGLTPAQLRAEVAATLDDFLAGRTALMTQISPQLGDLATAICDLVAGGKRLRPAFCVWGYVAGGGTDVRAAVRAATALELVQAAALLHDDVMDDSHTRRGQPAAHRRFATIHCERGWRGQPDRFGENAAILAGDLCLGWADEVLHGCGLPGPVVQAARSWYDLMRTELMCGQYLDLLEQVNGDGSAQAAEQVVSYKTVKYTTERPLQIGAALAGASPQLIEGLGEYGRPVGEAFQFRDDILGVFGDPATTGKPAGDDLREGKRTLLVALALQRATAGQAQALTEGLGRADLDPAGVSQLRGIIVATGALAELEEIIAARVALARARLDELDVPVAARDALFELAGLAAQREQ